jgi:hypothetical protein
VFVLLHGIVKEGAGGEQVEGSPTESSALFINLYWAPKVMRASSFLILRRSGGEMAGEESKPTASPTGSGQVPPKATAANMCTEELR